MQPPHEATRYWHYAAAWLAGSAVHVALLLNTKRSVLYTYGLTDLEQLALACVELVLFALVLAFVALAQRGAQRLVQRLQPHRAVLKVGKALTSAALVFAICCYGASWAMFRSLGSFLDGEGLRFAAANPSLLFQHLLEINLAGVSAGFLLGSGALVAIVTYGPARRRTASPETKLRIVQASTVALTLVASLVVTTSGLVWLHRDENRTTSGIPMKAAALVQGALGAQVGPLSRVLMAFATPPKIFPIDVPSTHGPSQASGQQYMAAAMPAARPNVVVLVIEGLREDAWRLTTPEPVMPNLQRLAQDSVLFTRAYSHANHSDYAAPCVVSSQYPLREQRHHYYQVKPDYPRVMLYDVLKGFGYRTAIVSSQNEHWGEMFNYLNTPGLDLLFHSETLQDPSRKVVDAEDVGFLRWTASLGRSGKLDDADTISEAVRWAGLDQQPFFLSINLQNSHFPYRFPPEHDRFRPSDVDFYYTYNNYPIEKNHVVRNRYYNALHYADAQVGKLLAALGSRLKDTIVVVTGDHGEAFFEHGFGQHGSELYEETIRVPLIMHLPGQAPRSIDGVASHVDVAPTVLSAMGLEPHPAMQGHDLLQPIPEERAAFVTVQTPLRWDLAVITRRHKLITTGALEQPRLVDLEQDPRELTNLAPSEPELLEELTRRLKIYRDAQLTYYHNHSRMRDEYPPRVQ